MRLFNRLHTLSRWKKVVLSLLVVTLSLSTFTYLWLFRDLPAIDDLDAGLALPSTRIYDRHGRLLYEILPPEQGRNRAIALDDIPTHCTNAVIATEDANFYNHPGVDVVGIVRALWINLRGGEVIAGGSTITQQVARNLLLDPTERAERTLRRKLREVILAVRLQQQYSKDEVLGLYLNQVYFGNLAYGVEAAGRAYFGKGAADLSLAECAILVGTLQAPSIYDPLSNLDAAKERQAVVLRLMVQNAMLSQTEADAARRDELQFASSPFPIDAPHFVMAVWKQLEREYPEQVYGGGLEVITTVDADWQRVAQEIAQTQLVTINNPPDGGRAAANANNAALVAIDPYTGQVLTMLGSPDYFDEAIDGAVNAALAPRQPGSALKPFTYAAAMNPTHDNPYTAATMILDVETPFVTRRLESYTPSNFALVEHGPVLVREALASSYNIPAVVALEHVGVQSLVSLMNDLGVTTLAENPNVDLAITLGGGEVRLLDLTAAYGAFANGGHRVDPVFILQVSDTNGRVLHQWRPSAEQHRVLDERVAYVITDILSDPTARVTSFGVNSALDIGRPAAAKTGTTTDFRDNWVVGYTPNLTVGVWVGNADNTPMVDVTGVSGAGPIWNAFMRQVLVGQPRLAFDEPEGITRAEVCALSGLLPTPECTLRRTEIFIAGTEPTEYDTFYQAFEVDRTTGLLATDDTAEEDRVEQVFAVLPQEARDWALRAGMPQPPIGATIIEPDADLGLRLLEPDPYTTFQISPMIPQETQRLRLTVGAPPGTQSVTYYMDDEPLGTVDAEPWALWWALELGEHELVAVSEMADGSTQRSEPIPFGVTQYEPPQPGLVGE